MAGLVNEAGDNVSYWGVSWPADGPPMMVQKAPPMELMAEFLFPVSDMFVAGDILKVYGNGRLMGTVPTCVISHALDLCARCRSAYALEPGSTCHYCPERRQR